MQIAGMPDKNSIAAMLLSNQPQGTEQMLFGSRPAAAKGTEPLSFKQTLQQSQNATGRVAKEKLSGKEGKEAIAERVTGNARAEKQETVAVSEQGVTEKKDATMTQGSSATEDSSEENQLIGTDSTEQEEEDGGLELQIATLMPMLFQTLEEVVLPEEVANITGIAPEVALTDVTPPPVAVNDIVSDNQTGEQIFSLVETPESDPVGVPQEAEGADISAVTAPGESMDVVQTARGAEAKPDPANQPADMVVSDEEILAATVGAKDTLSRHQQVRKASARAVDTVQSENADELPQATDAAPDRITVGEPPQAEQPLRAKNNGDSSANEKNAVMAENTKADTPWNFNQLLADQTQLFQPVLNQTQNTASNVTVIAQIDHWLQALEAGNIQIHEGQVTEMEVTLQPRNLGKLVLKLEMENGELRAYFATQSQIVKQVLESQMSNLQDLLQQQGLNVGQLSVQVGNEGRQSMNFRENQTRASGRRTGNVAQSSESVAGEPGVQRAGELWSGLPGGRLYLRI